MKATRASEVREFTDIPNIGPAMVRDFMQLGIKTPHALAKADPYAMYRKLSKLTGTRQDPCVLDTYLAAVDFMQGAPARPWWSYTAQRKKEYPGL